MSAEALAICRRGVRNVLDHLGILAADADTAPRHGDGPILRIPGREGYVFAGGDGVFEGADPLGTWVEVGRVAGWVHDLRRPWEEPETLHYRADGMLFGRRAPGLVAPGNCCAVVAAPYEGEL